MSGAVPVTRRERTIAVAPAEIWAVVADPHHLPRWWPGVRRVEGVGADRFTKVLTTRKGRVVRMDYRLVAEEPGVRRRWSQEIEDTPFERLMDAAEEEVALEPAADGEATTVTLLLDRRLRGWSRFGGFFFRRAAREELDGALGGLAEAVGG